MLCRNLCFKGEKGEPGIGGNSDNVSIKVRQMIFPFFKKRRKKNNIELTLPN